MNEEKDTADAIAGINARLDALIAAEFDQINGHITNLIALAKSNPKLANKCERLRQKFVDLRAEAEGSS